MPEITLPVLLDDFGEIDLPQAVREIQGMERGESLILCQPSLKSDRRGVVVQSIEGVPLGRITPARLEGVKAKHGVSLPLTARFDKALMSGFQVKVVV